MSSKELALISLTALTLGVGATYLARKVALFTGTVDRPDGHRQHLGAVPLFGGVAIYSAFVVSLAFWADRSYVPQSAGILVGGLLMSFLGLWDDRRQLSPPAKLLGQVVLTAALVFAGVQVSLFGYQPVNVLVTMVWVLLITNAFNLIDNMDGLAGGIAAIASASFLVCAILNGQYLVGALSASLLGACIGFLFFNFGRASIFMGDAGSLFIGFVMAAVGIKVRFPTNVDSVTWMVPVLILGVPIFDTALVCVSRLRRRVPIWQAGRDHVSHRLADLGWTSTKVVFVLYASGLILGAAGAAVGLLSPQPAYAVGSVALAGGVCLAWWLEWAD